MYTLIKLGQMVLKGVKLGQMVLKGVNCVHNAKIRSCCVEKSRWGTHCLKQVCNVKIRSYGLEGSQ